MTRPAGCSTAQRTGLALAAETVATCADRKGDHRSRRDACGYSQRVRRASRLVGVLACAVAALAGGCSGTRTVQSDGPPSKAGAAAESNTAAPLSGGLRYLALGDSLTQGVGAPDESTGAFPALLAEHWRADGCEVELQNVGISGYTAGQILAEEVPQIESFQPNIITFQAGGNDIVNGISINEYRNNVSSVLDAAAGSGARVIVLAQNEWFRSPTGRAMSATTAPAQRAAFDDVLIKEASSARRRIRRYATALRRAGRSEPVGRRWTPPDTRRLRGLGREAQRGSSRTLQVLARGDGEQMPVAGHTLELVCAAVVELEARPDHEVAQRAGHQHLVRSGQCADPRADVHGDTADVVAANLALAGVQPGTYLDAERLHRVANRHGAADRSLRPVERRQEAITRRVHLATPKASQLRPHDGVVRIEQRMPVAVADLSRPARRIRRCR